jgi:S1-C subfamily serine protease
VKILAALVLALLLVPARAFALDLGQLADSSRASVVVVNVHGRGGQRISQGSGFFVSSDGRVVTNHHVIDDATSVTVTLADGSTRPAVGLLADSASEDIAILSVQGATFPSLALADSSSVKPGDEVAVIGSPSGFSGTLSSGIVSAVRERGAQIEGNKAFDATSWKIQITAAVSPGSSGSPVLGREGRVIGVAVGTFSGGQNLNFAIPADVVRAMLARLGPDARMMPFSYASGSNVVRNLLISIAVFGLLAGGYFVWSRLEIRKARRRSEKRWPGASGTAS